MAFVSVNRIKVRKRTKSGDKSAIILEKLLKKPGEVISTIVICNNLVNISASILAGVVAAFLFGNIGVGVATVIMTLLVVVFGEAIPKAYGIHNEKYAFRVSRSLSILIFVFSPISRGLSAFSRIFLSILQRIFTGLCPLSFHLDRLNILKSNLASLFQLHQKLYARSLRPSILLGIFGHLFFVISIYLPHFFIFKTFLTANPSEKSPTFKLRDESHGKTT